MPVNHLWGMRSVNGTDNQFGTTAEVYGVPEIENSRVIYGRVMNEAKVYDSLVSGNVLIGGEALVSRSMVLGNAIINGEAVVTSSSVCDNAVVTDRAAVELSDILGNSRVFENAYVKNARLKDEVIIRGEGRLIGVEGGIIEVGGYVFIDRGTWRRAPLHYVTSCGLVVVESVDNLVNISCITNDVRKILGKAGTRYGKIMGMTNEEIQEVQYCTELIAKETGKCY